MFALVWKVSQIILQYFFRIHKNLFVKKAEIKNGVLLEWLF